jgi:hypothetical protein
VLSGGTLPFLAFLQAPQARIEGITQGVSQEIEAKHSYTDSEMWEEDEPWRDFSVSHIGSGQPF